MVAVGLACAAIVPRSFDDQSQPGIVITSTQRGFPFTYAEDQVRTYADHTNRLPEAVGMRNLLFLAGDVMVVGIPIVILLLRSRVPVDGAIQTRTSPS